MSITRSSLNNVALTAAQRHNVAAALDRNMSCDAWAKNILKPVGVLLTSHPSNLEYLKRSLETHKQLGFWVAVVYDNRWDPKHKDVSFDKLMPDRDVFDLADTFIVSKQQCWGGVAYPYFWALRFGLQAMSMFEYIYCANGDCILEKPDNFPALLDMMGSTDVFFVGWDDTQSKPMANTTGFIAKRAAALKMLKHIQDHFVPFDVYEKFAAQLGSIEVRFARACLDLKLRVYKPVEGPYDLQLSRPGYGTWYKTIGFRHLHGEDKAAQKYLNGY